MGCCLVVVRAALTLSIFASLMLSHANAMISGIFPPGTSGLPRELPFAVWDSPGWTTQNYQTGGSNKYCKNFPPANGVPHGTDAMTAALVNRHQAFLCSISLKESSDMM